MNISANINIGNNNNAHEIFYHLETKPAQLMTNINDFATRVEYETKNEVWKNIAKNGYTAGKKLTISVVIDCGNEDLPFCEQVTADDLEILDCRIDHALNEISHEMCRELCFTICCNPAFGMGEEDAW